MSTNKRTRATSVAATAARQIPAVEPRRAGVDRLLSVGEVAAYLGVPVKTLYQWRLKGVGPKGMRVGRHLRYRRGEIDGWLDGLER